MKTMEEKKRGRPPGTKNSTEKLEIQKVQKPTCPSCSSTDAVYIRQQGNPRIWDQKTPFGDPAEKNIISLRECRNCGRQWRVQTWHHSGSVVAQCQDKK